MSTDEMKSTENENGSDVKPGTDIIVTLPAPTKYRNPVGTEYPVVAYNNVNLCIYRNGVVIKEAEDEEIGDLLQTVLDCGFNVNMFVNRHIALTGLLNKYFSKANSMGLKSILNVSGRMPIKNVDENGVESYDTSSLSQVLKLYQAKAGLWGYMLDDEPRYKEWEVNKSNPNGSSILKEAYKTYQNNANGRFAFFNLAADVNEKYTGKACPANADGKTKKALYKEYLQNFYNAIEPLMMCVDIYPAIKEKGVGSVVIKSQYFYTLEAIGEVSRDKEIPFWLFMQSNHFALFKKNGAYYHCQLAPTEGVLRYQAMNAIAHGIQGLVFWTYGMPDNKWYDNEKTKIYEAHITAPFANYIKTTVWTNCHNVIDEIKKYGKALLNAKFIEARHVYYGTPKNKDYPGTTRFDGQFGCIIRVEGNTGSDGVVITHLKNEDFNYMAIVNHSCEVSQQITVFIASDCQWFEFIGESFELKTERYVIRVLNPGGMLLIRYKS